MLRKEIKERIITARLKITQRIGKQESEPLHKEIGGKDK
jgi:hypothetical protein